MGGAARQLPAGAPKCDRAGTRPARGGTSLRAVGDDPGVLAVAETAEVESLTRMGRAQPRESAGHDDVTVRARRHEHAKREGHRPQALRPDDRRRRQRERGAREPGEAALLDERPGPADLPGLGPVRILSARLAGAAVVEVARFQPIEIRQDVLARSCIAAPPRLERRNQQVLAQQPPAQRREERHESLGVRQPAAEGVHHVHVAGPYRGDQPRDAEGRVAAQLERIAGCGLDASDDDVHGAQALEGLEEHPVVADGEIRPLGEHVALVAREVGVGEVAGRRGSRGQHDHARVRRVGDRRETVVNRLEESRELPHADRDELVGQAVSQRDAVLEREPAAHRRLAAILEYPPATVRAAADVRRVVVQAAVARHLDAVQRSQELRISEYQRRGQAALEHQPLLPVAVREDGVEQPCALRESRLERPPVVARDQQRHRIEAPGPPRGVVLVVDVVREAVLVKDAFDALPPRVEVRNAKSAQRLDEAPPVRPHFALGRLHLVVHAGQGTVAVEHRGERGLGGGRERLGERDQASWSSRGSGRRRSSVSGNSGLASSAGILTEPGECPSSENRARRRLSASYAFTGSVS